MQSGKITSTKFLLLHLNRDSSLSQSSWILGLFKLKTSLLAAFHLALLKTINYAKAFDYVDHNKLWKILKEMGIPDHLTCFLRNLYAGQEATVRTGHGTADWFQIGKGVCQGYILSPCLFNLYAEYIMRNAGLEEAQAGIKIAGRNTSNLRYADDSTLTAESEARTKELLDERGEWKSWLKA